MSRWYYCADSQFCSDFQTDMQGPVSFQDLATMVRRGDLHEDDLVRRELETEPQPVHSVVGLLRAATVEASLASRRLRNSVPVERDDYVTDEDVAALHADSSASRREFMYRFFLWAPTAAVAALTAYGAYQMLTYDVLDEKEFEAD